MPSPASTKKVATKKASSSNKVARKKAPKPKKPAAKPKPKTAKKPAAKKASAKKTKTAVKKAGTTKPKARKAKHAPKAKATKAASKAEVATVAKAQSSAAEPASLLDEFYSAHPHLRMPVVFFTFSEDPLDEDNRYASKVGGHPFWPASKAWDKSTMGSLRLFMQINFADVPSDHGIAGMPTDGIFQIFWNNYEAASSADADDDAVQGPDTFVIRYWPVEDVSAAASDGKLLSTENLPSLEGDNSMMGLDPTTPHGIEFRAATKMFVTRSDYRFQAAFSKWAKERNLDSEVAHYVYSEAHHRDGDADHGLLGGSPHSFNGDFRQLDAAEPYELLLQIKSEGPLMCGDCGLESFFIRPTRLAARDFSQVQYVHDE